MIKGAANVSQAVKNIGWRVTFAGLGINLALGILYTWSVIKKGLPTDWSDTERSLPYSVACLVFCLVMVPAGRLQDKVGPRLVASVGGILVGIGMILASMWVTPMGILLGFGVLAGAGIGFGYASATPPAVKWFPSAKTGLIAGLVVSGFGLASVYAAPLAAWLNATYGLEKMLLSLGIAFLIVVVALAQLLAPPPKGYVPAGQPQPATNGANGKKEEFTPKEMLGTLQFYLLWFMYACGAGAGLMIIGNLARIGEDLTGKSLGFVLVAALAVGNGGGRVAAGVISDKLGRQMTMFGFFVLQAVLILALSMFTPASPLASVAVLAVLSALIGANYGSNLALFPSITKDYFGAKNFGMNYGLVFTAWGVGGFMLSLLAGQLRDRFDTLAFAYYGSAALLAVAAVMTFMVKPPHIAHSTAGQVGSDAIEEAGPELEKAVAETA
ncbi:MAG TPA: OFA family MFS transporter [Thermoguttaceae bacterium]|nr:OFA family MFS transporter [Thermoguttaceae bacterium]